MNMKKLFEMAMARKEVVENMQNDIVYNAVVQALYKNVCTHGTLLNLPWFALEKNKNSMSLDKAA